MTRRKRWQVKSKQRLIAFVQPVSGNLVKMISTHTWETPSWLIVCPNLHQIFLATASSSSLSNEKAS